MSEVADHTLALLRRIDGNVSRLVEDVHDLKVRVTSIETNMAGFNRRLDRFEDRLDRIERRLEFAEAT